MCFNNLQVSVLLCFLYIEKQMLCLLIVIKVDNYITFNLIIRLHELKCFGLTNKNLSPVVALMRTFIIFMYSGYLK